MRCRTRGVVPLAFAMLLAAPTLARTAAAQSPGAIRVGAPQPELRADAIVGADRRAYQLGAGVLWPVGRAVRAGVVLAAGVADGAGLESPDIGWRAELVGHFVLRASEAGRARLYVGAGVGALSTDDERRGGDARALVHALVGVAGGGAGWAPAVELGIGGGVRLGVVLRRAR